MLARPSRPSRLFAAALVPLLAATAAGCTSGSSSSSSTTRAASATTTVDPSVIVPNGDRKALLAKTATTVLLPDYQALRTSTAALVTAASTCAVGPAAPALQDAWKATDTAWAGVGTFSFGPQMDQRLAQTMAFWPVAAGKIDAFLAAAGPADAAAVDALGADQRGLPGIEHVLFSGEALTERACGYIKGVAGIMATKADAVAKGWEALAPTFADQSRALDDVVSGLTIGVYDVAETIGLPSGLLKSSPTPDPSKARENVTGATYAVPEFQARLVEVEKTIDLLILPLIAVIEPEAAADLQGRVDAAKKAVGALPTVTIKSLATANLPATTTAFDALKDLQRALATDVPATLGITLSFSSADGD